MFVTVVAAADHLDFARSVFLTAFIILMSGAVLAFSLAFGLGGRDAVRRYLQDRAAQDEGKSGRSLWNHL
jgi:hypothetical protein